VRFGDVDRGDDVRDVQYLADAGVSETVDRAIAIQLLCRFPPTRSHRCVCDGPTLSVFHTCRGQATRPMLDTFGGMIGRDRFSS
jgi:hypothetical protein